MFTSVGWQVILYDPMWQVTLRSSEMGSHEELCALCLTFSTAVTNHCMCSPVDLLDSRQEPVLSFEVV